MLVLTRREGEEILIGDPADPSVIIRVCTIRGDRVRIGVRTPADPRLPVNRREIAEQKAATGKHSD